MTRTAQREKFGRFGEVVIASTPTGWLDPQRTRIDLARLEQRFFGNFDGELVPWRKPLPPLPLDDFLDILRTRSRAPKLRPKAELTRLKWECPYRRARVCVFMAVAHAESRAFIAARQIRDANAARKAASKIQRELQRIASELDQQNYYLRNITELLQKPAKRIAAYAEEIKGEIRDLPDTRGKPDFWKIEFVFVLGFVWHALTGRSPSPPGSGDVTFVRFVEAAYDSVDPEREETWDSQIKTALALVKRRPPDDRWNRAEFLRLSQPASPK
jgi:hypothetical protein